MPGKLFLDLGKDYAFDIRRARAVAEGVTPLPGDQVVSFGGVTLTLAGIPANQITLTASGTASEAAQGSFRARWVVSGSPRDQEANFSWSAGATETEIATLIAAEIDSQTELVVAVDGVVLNQVNISRSSAGAIDEAALILGPGLFNELQPGEEQGPFSSSIGASYWLKRSGGQGTIWYVGFNIDTDPNDAEAYVRLSDFQSNTTFPEAYTDEVLSKARALGWPG